MNNGVLRIIALGLVREKTVALLISSQNCFKATIFTM